MSSFIDTIKHHPLVLVDFYTTWCEPCKKMKVILNDVEKEEPNMPPVVNVNLDKNQLVAKKLQIQTIPTLMLFKRGKVIWKQSGVVPASTLKQVIKKFS